MNDRMTNKIVDNNIEEIMKEEKTVYSNHGEIIFSVIRSPPPAVGVSRLSASSASIL